MSATDFGARTQFQIACGEIDGWRGRCLELYARSERAIAETIEHAKSHGRVTKLQHLAGQRFADLEKMISAEPATNGQMKAIREATSGWSVVEEQRVFLAHGVVEELIGRDGNWWAVLDVTVYGNAGGSARRWTVSKGEAEAFRVRLTSAFAVLSCQLGQLRIRIAAAGLPSRGPPG